jgi:uncharacterized protein YecT (DUF1311 family)
MKRGKFEAEKLMMGKVKTLLTTVWIAAGLAVGLAQAASFDCRRAVSKIEKLICGDDDLSKLDEALSKTYQQALERSHDKQETTNEQRQWLKEVGNSCQDADCLKKKYQTKINKLKALLFPGSGSSKQRAKEEPQNDMEYEFQITKGKGVPVCDAYLERLNTTDYVKPPYCDRPENDGVKGFARLNRVALTPADIHDLYPIVWTFMSLANSKNLDWPDMSFQQHLTQSGQFKLAEEGSKLLQMYLDKGWAEIWRYDPPVDIDNDGVPDNVEVWEGGALPIGIGGRQCGDDVSDIFGGRNDILHQPQVALVILDNNDRLNVHKTVEIFAHPMGSYRFYDAVDKKWKISDAFRPIGRSIGIFKYQDIYYFDTFFDGWGDFKDKRQRYKNIDNTLAVFLHKNGKTRQVCEYLMTDNDSKITRGKK